MTNRYICTVIEEARKCHDTRNYSYLPGLLEEVQTLANRMEAALGDKHDVEYYRRQRTELKDEIKALKKKKEKLQKKKKSKQLPIHSFLDMETR